MYYYVGTELYKYVCTHITSYNCILSNRCKFGVRISRFEVSKGRVEETVTFRNQMQDSLARNANTLFPALNRRAEATKSIKGPKSISGLKGFPSCTPLWK